ncbi:MAG: hypothetical protein C4300_08395, partial [Thermus sp.]
MRLRVDPLPRGASPPGEAQEEAVFSDVVLV